MLKKNRTISITFLTFMLLISCCYTQAKSADVIKIALLDKPYDEMPSISFLSEYEKAYIAGVETAAKIAKKYNIEIKYKSFIYGKGSLDILGQVSKIEQQQVDLVIGPNSSDQFLLLRNYLQDVMVLSAYASGDALRTLPKNFYSTFLPDSHIIKLLVEFIKARFPQKNIYIIEQIDCKQCIDISKLFVINYKKISPNIRIVEDRLIMDNIRDIDSKKLMANHVDDVILVFNNAYYDYNTFVSHITTSFPDKNLIFFSDQDNWSNEVDGSKHKLDLNYESYRISPIIFDMNSPEFKNFAQTYYEIYHTKPSAAISYLTYVAVLSAVEALHRFPLTDSNKSMRKKVLYSYLAALQKNPNWFRLKSYGIYQMTTKGEVLVQRLPASKLI